MSSPLRLSSINYYNPPIHAPLIDPATAGSISGSGFQTRFRQKLLFTNCSSSSTWVGNGEARSVGDR